MLNSKLYNSGVVPVMDYCLYNWSFVKRCDCHRIYQRALITSVLLGCTFRDTINFFALEGDSSFDI